MTSHSPLRRLVALGLAIGAGLSAGACSDPPEKKADATSGIGDPGPTSTTQAPALPTTSTAPAARPTTSVSPPTSRTSTAGPNIVIAPDGLGVARFGDPADVTMARLTAKLGAPSSDDRPRPPCTSKITRIVSWPSITVSLGPTFVGYTHNGPDDTPRFRTEAGIGLDSTVAQMKAAYGSKLRLDPGEEGTPFSISLTNGTLRGTAFSPEDADVVYALFAGTQCAG